MSIRVENFGSLSDGRQAVLCTIENENGARVSLTNLGAAITSLWVPDRQGQLRDVVLGCDSAAAQEKQGACFGAVPGRHANRIGGGRFQLNGKEYQLACNNHGNHLHGGLEGFHKKLWNYAVYGDKVIFSRLSPNGEEGYPGNLLVSVAYSLDENNQLLLEYHALSDEDTVLNLTNHAYFNLEGHDSGSVALQELRIFADSFTENDPNCLPTGRILPVEGTPFDFRAWKPIGQDWDADEPNIKNGDGYDHNFILGQEGDFALCAQAYAPGSGIRMDVYTTQPGVQLYTANNLQPEQGKGGVTYGPRQAFCLETQHWPNAMAHGEFPSVVLRAGELFEHLTAFSFAIGK